MKKNLKLIGVKTNNLKNIDLEIIKNSITSITGISGGGKSSLAYNTIYALCHQEFSAISDGYFEDAKYLIKEYEGIAPAVSIKQNNVNSNPRSTIYSYYNFFSLVNSIKKDKKNNPTYEDLRINKPGNECKFCNGMAVTQSIDENKVVDYDAKISENPFIPWKSKSSNKFYKLLEAYCTIENIDKDKKFSQLPKRIQSQLLYSNSDEHLLIKFKHNGKYRQIKMTYSGPMTILEQDLSSKRQSEYNNAIKYSTAVLCSNCRGSRISVERYRSILICGISMIDFLSLDIDSIIRRLNKYESSDSSFLKLHKILKIISRIGLGYLTLSRSIPSLSGGELQKLNFCRLLISDLSGIIVVIDEISSQVHASDYEMLFQEIKNIKNLGNTIILVEHNVNFIKNSDYVIEIGPAAGRHGGHLIKTRNLHNEGFKFPPKKMLMPWLKLPKISKNNVKSLSLEIVKNGITILCGKSGAGKSSIAKYLSENLENVIYISQKSVRGSIRSTVSSYLEISQFIATRYAENFSKDIDIFLSSSGKQGCCETCGGTGIIRYSRSYDSSIDVPCETCDGKLFSKNIDEYKIDNLSIADLYNLPVEQVLSEAQNLSKKITSTLEMLCSLGLGHLSLNRKTPSLSGGELRRLKLLKHLTKRSAGNILIIDEPGAGLDDTTCENLMFFLESHKKNYLAIIAIDHKPSIFLHADYLLEIGPGSGNEGGNLIYSGLPDEFFHEKYVKYLKNHSLSPS